QDPFASLDPRMSVSQLIAEPIRSLAGVKDSAEITRRVYELMDLVGLARRLENVYPHELDGGRRQRIGIARALASEPQMIVCDEPVSALDVSIQAQILNLLQDLQKERSLTYIFITHDLSVVKHISDQIVVMYLGQIVEKADSKELFANTLHPYTQALLSAIPIPSLQRENKRIVLKGELSSPIDPKPGCRFAPRCIYATDKCRGETPELRDCGNGHYVACHYAGETGINSD
ncbi:MAG: ATP-binding cassette domain-containing protein, partial [Oscillospiraceae bacterium]|nr:ATP-binding cassette domain-containing protein [Oscillospiraceae bacterium]